MTEPTVQIPLSLAKAIRLDLQLLVELFETDEAKELVRAEVSLLNRAIDLGRHQAALTQSQYADTVNPLCRPQND